MTHPQKCGSGKLCIFLITLLCSYTSVLGQTYQQQRQEFLDSLDLTGLGSRLFLNAAITSKNEVDYLKNISNGAISASEQVSAEEFQNLYERLIDADLRIDSSKIPPFEKLTETDPRKITRNNDVSIAILNLSSIYFTGSEIENNKTAKRQSRQFDFEQTDKFDIVYASILQEDVYQSDVSFRLNKHLYISNYKHLPENIALDFGDGKGYQTVTFSEKPIAHRFQTTGMHKLLIRFSVGKKTFVFETRINVRQLERQEPFKEFEINVARITSDTTSDRSARTALVGGNIRIILGCDQLFNKPIIIAEGFDMGNDVTLDIIESRYRTQLNQYLREGYDLVLLDYADGRAAIQDNAQVLKALVKQVNQMKSGNAQLIVIGESMGGLVARWALRELENEGVAHQIKLMVCYDTPHQGANVPVGLTQLAWEATPTMLSEFILKFFTKGWRNYYNALATPAAQQLLLHWGGALSGGVGSKSPLFDAFRVQLNALGNGGYPATCRNIAVIHGSLNAGDRRLFDDYNYGSRILLSWMPFGPQNANIDVHTNDLDQNKNVFRFASWGLFSKVLGVSRKYSSAFNDDFLPGGRTTFLLRNKLFKVFSDKSFDFCFVPTFSSVDYQGPRNTQAEREFLNVGLISNQQTPFAATYGGVVPNLNSDHVAPASINWQTIGFAENLLTGTNACPNLPVPPQPVISTGNICHAFSEKRSTEDNTPNITVTLATPSNGQYIHNWTVLPSNQYFTTTGDQITFQAERADHYEVTCVRSYPNRRDISSTFTKTIWVFDCNDQSVDPGDETELTATDADIDITDIWEGDFLVTTATDNLEVFAHYEPISKILYASLADDTFVAPATLVQAGMFPEFAELFAATDPREALPVTLVSFHAEKEGASVRLNWVTNAEIQCDHFEIERSTNGKKWDWIGNANAQAIEGKGAEYFFTDTRAESGKIYYRLKMIDADQSFAYSRIVTVYNGSADDTGVFPNPLVNGDEMRFLNQEKVGGYAIYQLNGTEVLRSDTNEINAGNNLPAGKYILKMKLKDGKEVSRIITKR